ncbi:MAG: hypothetical protein J6A30_09170 [Ruminococcus sp.]|nr:hypothetical protein [Ruminococcus sp.]
MLYAINDVDLLQKIYTTDKRCNYYKGGGFLEYAIVKGTGEKVSAKKTSERGLTYVCPYCGEEKLTLKKGNKNAHSFGHHSKSDRTPLEKTCPGYTKTDKIKDNVLKLYIKNGGVPVYLHKSGDRFYIDAIFPQLSQQSLNILKGATLEVDQSSYNITSRDGIIFHRLNNINSKWINVTIEDNRKTNPEIEQKWLCGIMGLNKIEQSIFQCNINGGYRIGHNNHVYVGQKYYIITHSQDIQNIPGIEYTKKGSISLTDTLLHFGQSSSYYVYIMKIISATKEAKDEICRRQYVLCEKASESYPIWPPCHILGNQLVYKDKKAFFFLKSNKDEYYSYHDSIIGNLRKINCKDNYCAIDPEYWKCIYTAYDVYDTIENKEINIPIENIQWYIAYQKEIQLVKQSDYYFELIDDNNDIISSGNIEWKNVCDFKIKSNVPVTAIVKKGEFVVGCHKEKLENLMLGMTIILDAGSYGQKSYYIVNSQGSNKQDYSSLLTMSGMQVRTDSIVKTFYARIKDAHPLVAKQVKKWILAGSIPAIAKKYIYNEMRK